jgi:hypothetical protein
MVLFPLPPNTDDDTPRNAADNVARACLREVDGGVSLSVSGLLISFSMNGIPASVTSSCSLRRIAFVKDVLVRCVLKASKRPTGKLVRVVFPQK